MGGSFAILNPCPKKWSDLEGEGRARFCRTCQTHVHSIADYSTEEWNRLWQDSKGRVCGFLCGESPRPPRSRRAILVGALLTAVAPLLAQSGRARIRVTDPTGTVVPHATVSLLGSNDRPIRTEPADERGEVLLTDLPLGDSRFSVVVPGFMTFHGTVTVRGSEEQVIEAHLLLGTTGTVVTIDLAQPAQMPNPQTLDQPAQPAPLKPTKRHWWQIFR
jgi:hypothetical protein